MAQLLDTEGLKALWARVKAEAGGKEEIRLPWLMTTVKSNDAPGDIAGSLGELATTEGYNSARSRLLAGTAELVVNDGTAAREARVVYYNMPALSGSYIDAVFVVPTDAQLLFLTYRANLSGGSITDWLLYIRVTK